MAGKRAAGSSRGTSKKQKNLAGAARKAKDARKAREAAEAAVVAGRMADAGAMGMVLTDENGPRLELPLADRETSAGLVALDGADVTLRATSRKTRFIFVLPLHLRRASGSGGSLGGTLRGLDTLHPTLDLPMKDADGASGVLRLQGSIVRSEDARFLLLKGTASNKSVQTSSVYDTLVMFSSGSWTPSAGGSAGETGAVPVSLANVARGSVSSKGADAGWPHVSSFVPSARPIPTARTAGAGQGGEPGSLAKDDGGLKPSPLKHKGSAAAAFPVVNLASLSPAKAPSSVARSAAGAKKNSKKKRGAARRMTLVDSDDDDESSDSDAFVPSGSPASSSPAPAKRPTRARRSTARRASYVDLDGGDDESSY